MDKLKGICWAIDQIANDGNKFMNDIHEARFSLEDQWNVLLPYPYMGPFMAYEVVTDWRHTWLGDQAEDIFSWANPGPGARRGLNIIHGRPLEKTIKIKQCVEEMKDLLHASPAYIGVHVPDLEMRDIEHSLCEFDKYERVRLGEGKPRSIYKP